MCNDELPDFSVLMSVYQQEKPVFLDQALMSIEEQTVIPDQIVLVEDGPLTAELDKVIEEHQKRFSNKYERRIVKSSATLSRRKLQRDSSSLRSYVVGDLNP